MSGFFCPGGISTGLELPIFHLFSAMACEIASCNAPMRV
jgi:hypothetical protein